MLFSDINTALGEMEDFGEQNTLMRDMRHHKQQLSMYREKRKVELEQFKGQVKGWRPWGFICMQTTE